MQIHIYCKITLHVSGVTAPIIRFFKAVTAISISGHNIGTGTSLQRGLVCASRVVGTKLACSEMVCAGRVMFCKQGHITPLL